MLHNLQTQRAKSGTRTMDEIEIKRKKKYDVIIGDQIKFVKRDLLNKAEMLKKIQ